MTSINLAIVDDHALIRKTLKSFLSDQRNMNVMVEASDVSSLLDKLKTSPVDILLMDISLPEINGSEAVKIIRSEYPDIKILVVSNCKDMDMICDLLENGIHGYVSKGDEPEDLLEAIQAVAENKIFRNHLITEALYLKKENAFSKSDDVLLNDREKKIIQLIWEEKSNKEIADTLFIGVRSVEKVRKDLKGKIGVKSTVGLLKYAMYKRIIGTSLENTDLIE
jgi:DNA-binding NarL/FixJ family response regulator